MSESTQARPKRSPKRPVVQTAEADSAERSLGRAVALGLPGTCLLAAAVVGVAGSVGSALLILASGTLLGAIALVWTSIRTLSGDAPVWVELQAVAGRELVADALVEEKLRVLRALKDIDSEHALGRLDDADYEVLVSRYREEAKDVMRRLDEQVAPMREEAERRARQYVARHGIRAGSAQAAAPDGEAPRKASRIACTQCGGSNETDAVFCKACGGPLGRAEVR